MSGVEYFQKFLTPFPNPSNYFYSKIRSGTFTYNKIIEHRSYEKLLTECINRNFPKKERLLKAKEEWVSGKHKHILDEWWKIPKENHIIIAGFSDNYDDYGEVIDNEDRELADKRYDEDANEFAISESAINDYSKVILIGDSEDSISEKPEDLSLVEFNSYEIRNKIRNFINVYPQMPMISRIICDNIEKENLDSQDLLPEGIIDEAYLERYHENLYDLIRRRGCISELRRNGLDMYYIRLTTDEKNFITDHIKHGYCIIPNVGEESARFYNHLGTFLTQMEQAWKLPEYKRRSPDINERSYSHQVIKPIIDFLLYNIEGINVRFYENRNGGQSGPLRYPDVVASKDSIYYEHKWEFLFCKISNGPYSPDPKHYWDDKLRLGKFSRDSWNHDYHYTRRFYDSDQAENMMDELNYITIHFYNTKMDFHILDHKLKPFHRMYLVDSLEIPTVNYNEKLTIRSMKELCKGILRINRVLVDTTMKIGRIGYMLEGEVSSLIQREDTLSTFTSPDDQTLFL